MSDEEASTGTTGTEEIGETNVGVPRAHAATTAGSQFIPERPKFGGIKETGPDTFTPWTGGKPKADFTGLEEPDPKSIRATQFRPSSISS